MVGPPTTAEPVAAHLDLPNLTRLCHFPTRWQYVIHGETGAYRAQIVEHFVEQWGIDRTRRFAMCGMGDVACGKSGGLESPSEVDQADFAILPRGCGERVCPRCSRRAGARSLRLIAKRFHTQGHDRLYHAVVTQRVRPREPIEKAYARVDEKRARVVRRMKELGALGGVSCVHIAWSRLGGWHIHFHLIVEASSLGLDEVFAPLKGDADWSIENAHLSEVSPPRTSDYYKSDRALLTELEDDPAGEALGYVHGELLKSVDIFHGVEVDGERLIEFVEWVRGRQLVRRWGAWTKDMKKVAAEVDAEAKAAMEDAEKNLPLRITVNVAIEYYLSGINFGTGFWKWLCRRYPMESGTGQRLRSVVGPAP